MFQSMLELQVWQMPNLCGFNLFFIAQFLQKKNPSLEPEEQRLLDRLLRDGRRNGLCCCSLLKKIV